MYVFVLTSGSSTAAKEIVSAIEVLALTEETGGTTEYGCGGHVTYTKDESLKSDICLSGGTHKKCKDNTGVCCNPAEQTDCPPIKIVDIIP